MSFSFHCSTQEIDVAWNGLISSFGSVPSIEMRQWTGAVFKTRLCFSFIAGTKRRALTISRYQFLGFNKVCLENLNRGKYLFLKIWQSIQQVYSCILKWIFSQEDRFYLLRIYFNVGWRQRPSLDLVSKLKF